MAIVPWAALGGGQLMSSAQRKEMERDSKARTRNAPDKADIEVANVLEEIAKDKGTTVQAVVSPIAQYDSPSSLCN